MPRRTYAKRLVQALASRCPGVWADADADTLWLSLPNTATARIWLPDDRRAAITDQVVDELIARAATWLRAERRKYTEHSKAAADVLLWILDHPRDREPRGLFAATSTQPIDLDGPRLHLGQLAHDAQGRAQLTLDRVPLDLIRRDGRPQHVGPGYHQAWQYGYGYGRLAPDAHAWLMQQWRAHAAPCDLATEQVSLVTLMRAAARDLDAGQPSPYNATLGHLLDTFPDKNKPWRLDH